MDMTLDARLALSACVLLITIGCIIFSWGVAIYATNPPGEGPSCGA